MIISKRSKGENVGRNFILGEALREFGDPHFQASPGWFDNFKKRWKLTRRVATHIIQKLSEDYSIEVISV